MKLMPRKGKKLPPSNIDIFQMMFETKEKAKIRLREELLAPLGVEDLFLYGEVSINKSTCEGVECRLCIKACPTSALFWKAGEVRITRELCIYCGACVLSCMVDDCIKIVRRRMTGEIEKFSTPREFTSLQHNINTKKRCERVRGVFPNVEEYLKKYDEKRN